MYLLQQYALSKRTSCFTENDVFQLQRIRKEGIQVEVWIVTYKILLDNGNSNDKCKAFIPERICSSCKICILMCVYYMGLQPSINGDKWHDVSLIDSDGVYRSLKDRCADNDERTMEAWDPTEDLFSVNLIEI